MKRNSLKNRWFEGFTLIEILVVIGMILILFLLGQNLSPSPQQVSTVSNTLDALVTDISAQQNKSMNGDLSLGSVASNYGVYFQSDRYILFKGSSYNQGATDNFTISLSPTISFSTINLPSTQLIFATGSGVLTNYNQSQRTITIHDATNNTSKTIQFNSFGVVESAQ